MKTTIVLGLLLLSVSCVTQKLPEVTAGTTDVTTGGTTGGGGQPPVVMEAMAPRLVRVMNYNQYNMTLSKLTGINHSKVSVLFEQLKGSLPGDTNIEAMTSFNLVAMSRLADFYCGIYINGERDDNGVLVVGGEPILDAKFLLSEEIIKNHLLDKFLDYDESLAIYDSLEGVLHNILTNQDYLLPTTSSLRNRSVLACVAILASSHITLLQ